MKLILGQRILCALGNIGPGLARMPVAEMRRIYDMYDQFFGSGSRADVITEDRSIPAGEHRLGLRIYRPKKINPKLSLVYFHGGGYMIGSLKSHHGFCSLLASKAGINVIAVDYRLSPEFPFPGPVEDGLQAWNWVVGHRAELGIENTRIGVGGDSAGGNLAAVLSMQTFKQVIPGALTAKPEFQFLLYPWVDMNATSESIERFGKGLLLTKETMVLFRSGYLPDGADDLAIQSSPMACEDMRGIPDTLMVTAEYDVLRDEGLAFADKLKEAGVSLDHQHFPDCTHGFISMGKFSGATRRRLRQLCNMLVDYGNKA